LGSGTDDGWYSISDVSATGDKLVNGKGYRVLVRGDRSINLTGTAANQNATTTQITGTYPANGQVSIPLTNSGRGKNYDGINFVGNPYPANLSWSAIVSANSSIGLDAAYAVYDVQNGRYNVYNSISSGTASDDIAAGQGFLVYTSSSSVNLIISESCKNTSALGDRYFKKQRNNHLVINMSYDTLYSDKSIVYFLPGSTLVYDKYDAGHIQNPYVNLSSLDATNSQYTVNCLDTLDTERTVPLSVKGTAPGDFSMTFEDCGTFQNNDIYLFDKFLNKKIKIDDMTKYDFSITTDPFTAEDGRLSLFFTPKETSKINTIEKTTWFTINPNPVTDNFTINYTGQSNVSVEYSIVTIDGKEVKKGNINTSEKINAKDLARGIYFMNIKSQNESQTIKFIK
jgi:hypothetical protein